MKKTAKTFFVLTICSCLSAGCTTQAAEAAASASATATAEASAEATDDTTDEVDPNKVVDQPIESRDDPANQPDYVEGTDYDYEPIESSISYAEMIKEAAYRYYDPADQQGTLQYFSYNTYRYDTDSSAQQKYAVVYTPYGYDTTKQYDIMYLMHGAYGYAELFLGNPDEPTSMKNCIDHLIEDGSINPMIIVCPSYYDDNTQQYNDNEDQDIVKYFTSEFSKDLMPAVESNFSTYAERTDEQGLTASRDHRIFAGFSMGGVITWYIMAECMEYCRYYMPMSGMLYWGPDYPYLEHDKNKWSGQFLNRSIRAQGYNSEAFYVYTATGGYDEAQYLLENQVRSMARNDKMFQFGSSTDDSVNCTYGYSEYLDHSWDAVYEYVFNGLPIFSKKINARSNS